MMRSLGSDNWTAVFRFIRISVVIIVLFLLVACNSAPSEEATLVSPTASATYPPPATATIEPTPSPEEVYMPLPTGACGHPYFPAIEDRTLTYLNKREGRETVTSISFVDVNQSAFAIEVKQGPDVSKLVPWSCTSNGLLSPDFIENYTAALLFELVEPETSGITMIAADKMILGSTWTTLYTVHDMGSVETAAGVPYFDQELQLNHEVASKEHVSTTLADYPESYRVDTEGYYKIAITLGNDVIREAVAPVEFNSWYVENIGLVRQEFRVGFFDGSDTMTSITELIKVVDGE